MHSGNILGHTRRSSDVTNLPPDSFHGFQMLQKCPGLHEELTALPRPPIAGFREGREGTGANVRRGTGKAWRLEREGDGTGNGQGR